MNDLDKILEDYLTKHRLCCDLNDEQGRQFWSGAAYALRKLIHAEQSKTVAENVQ